MKRSGLKGELLALLVLPISALALAQSNPKPQRTIGTANKYLQSVLSRGTSSIVSIKAAGTDHESKELVSIKTVVAKGCALEVSGVSAKGTRVSRTFEWAKISQVGYSYPSYLGQVYASGPIQIADGRVITEATLGFDSYTASKGALEAMEFLVKECDENKDTGFGS